MLTVEIKDAAEARDGRSEVEIYCDRDGFDTLMKCFKQIENGESHVHLMSPSWAGNELSEEPQGKDSSTVLVHHLCIISRPQ